MGTSSLVAFLVLISLSHYLLDYTFSGNFSRRPDTGDLKKFNWRHCLEMLTKTQNHQQKKENGGSLPSSGTDYNGVFMLFFFKKEKPSFVSVVLFFLLLLWFVYFMSIVCYILFFTVR